jgi:hypothetical protein
MPRRNHGSTPFESSPFGTAPTVSNTGGVGAVDLGDGKISIRAADHNGWILLNGRLKSTLTTVQQLAATSLGIGANLPNQTGLAIVGAGAGFPLLSTGGAASIVISQSNLPNVNLAGGSHSHGITDGGHSHTSYERFVNNGTFNSNGSAGSSFGTPSGSATSSNTTGIGINASGALSIPLGGSNVPLNTQNPYLAWNTFLYLGV